MEPQLVTDTTVPKSQQQSQAIKANLFWYGLYGSVAMFFIGVLGLLLSLFTKRFRKRWKLYWLLTGIGSIGFLSAKYYYKSVTNPKA